MVVEPIAGVVRLSGTLRTNQWPTIKAAARMLLQEHPEGVVIDCGGITRFSLEGLTTFLEALKDIETSNLPILIANLPGPMQAELAREAEGRFHEYVSESVESAQIRQATSSQVWWDRLWGTV